MNTVFATSASDLYIDALKLLLDQKPGPAPRGFATREVRGARFELATNQTIIVSEARRLNYGFMVAEWLWILTGCALRDAILPFNRKLGQFANDHTFAGAYGPKWIEQLPFVLENLRADKDSRQAVVSLWRDRPRASTDTPCTLDWQFFVRDNALEMHATMRSNDAWLGLPYDLFTFTGVQRWLACELGVDVGRYFHHVGSFHLYERDEAAARRAIADRSPLPRATWRGTSERPTLAELQELLLSAANVKYGLNESVVTAHETGRWLADWTNRLGHVGPDWWVLPHVLLSGHKETRERSYVEGAFKGTAWQTPVGLMLEEGLR